MISEQSHWGTNGHSFGKTGMPCGTSTARHTNIHAFKRGFTAASFSQVAVITFCYPFLNYVLELWCSYFLDPAASDIWTRWLAGMELWTTIFEGRVSSRISHTLRAQESGGLIQIFLCFIFYNLSLRNQWMLFSGVKQSKKNVFSQEWRSFSKEQQSTEGLQASFESLAFYKLKKSDFNWYIPLSSLQPHQPPVNGLLLNYSEQCWAEVSNFYCSVGTTRGRLPSNHWGIGLTNFITAHSFVSGQHHPPVSAFWNTDI